MSRGACRVGDLHFCPAVTLAVPHFGGAAYGASPVVVHADTVPALRLGDFAACLGPPDVVFEGAQTVLVGGLPLCRQFHRTAHGGVMLQGSSSVLVGGATFSLPDNVTVRGPAKFQNETIRDIYLLSTIPSGQELLTRLAAAGEEIKILPEADPHNSFCAAHDWAAAVAGNPTGSTVTYNPDVAIYLYDSAGNKITAPPTVVLGHELVHALNNAEGTHRHGVDPSPPASQKTIAWEEAATIGTGSHKHDRPTENTIRHDLGLPRRDNHLGDLSPTSPTENIRPGGY